MKTNGQVLITGGTGYVGGRLIPLLLERGYNVLAMVRSPQKLLTRLWAHHMALEIVPGDALDQASFINAGEGCDTAYYLIHSMNAHNTGLLKPTARPPKIWWPVPSAMVCNASSI